MPALTLVLGTQSAIIFSFSTWLPSYLTHRGWPIESVGPPLVWLAIGTLLAGVVTLPLDTRFGSRKVIVVSALAVVGGLAFFLFWPDQGVWICALSVGLGTTITFGITLAAPALLAPPHRIGTTAGLMLAIGYVESALGPLSMGAFRDAFGSYEAGWWFVTILALILVAAGLAVPSKQRTTHPA